MNVKSADKAGVTLTNNEKTDVNYANVQIASQVTVPSDAVCVVTAESSAGKFTTTNTAGVVLSSAVATNDSSSVIRESNTGGGAYALNPVCADSETTDLISSVHSGNPKAAKLTTEDITTQDTDSCDSNIEGRVNNVPTVSTPCASIPSSDGLLSVLSSQPTCSSTPKSDYRQQHKAGGSCRHVKSHSEFPTAEVVYVYVLIWELMI